MAGSEIGGVADVPLTELLLIGEGLACHSSVTEHLIGEGPGPYPRGIRGKVPVPGCRGHVPG